MMLDNKKAGRVCHLSPIIYHLEIRMSLKILKSDFADFLVEPSKYLFDKHYQILVNTSSYISNQ